MTEKEYRQHPAISRSELWRIRESPEKFKWYREHPEQPSPTLIFGQVFHKLALEPNTFYDEFAVSPIIDRRTKEGKVAWAEFVESSADKTVIDCDSYHKAQEMVDCLYRVPFVKKLLDGEHEKPVFWTDDLTGEACKARYDALVEVNKQPIIVDLKTTTDASTDAFMRSAIRLGYDFQSGMYCDGLKKTTGKNPLFVFIAIEKEPPYAVNILQCDELMLRRGYDLFREYIGIYHDCKQTGNFYGYLGKYNQINNLALPSFLAKEIE